MLRETNPERQEKSGAKVAVLFTGGERGGGGQKRLRLSLGESARLKGGHSIQGGSRGNHGRRGPRV